MLTLVLDLADYFFLKTSRRSAKLFFFTTNQKIAKPPIPTTAVEPHTMPTTAPAPMPPSFVDWGGAGCGSPLGSPLVELEELVGGSVFPELLLLELLGVLIWYWQVSHLPSPFVSAWGALSSSCPSQPLQPCQWWVAVVVHSLFGVWVTCPVAGSII